MCSTWKVAPWSDWSIRQYSHRLSARESDLANDVFPRAHLGARFETGGALGPERAIVSLSSTHDSSSANSSGVNAAVVVAIHQVLSPGRPLNG